MKFTALMIAVLMLTVACENEAAAPAERSAPTDNGDFGDLDQGGDGGDQVVEPTEPVSGCGSNEGATFNGLSCEEAKAQYDKAVVDCIESGKFFDVTTQECTNTELSTEDCTVEAIKARHEGNLDTFNTLISDNYTILACIQKASGLSEYFIYTPAGNNSEGKITFQMKCTVLGTEDKDPEFSDTCRAN